MLYQLSYLGAGPVPMGRVSRARGVIKARFRTVQNGARLARKSWFDADGGAEPLFECNPVAQRQDAGRLGGGDDDIGE
jgi:hypothetical protein